MNWAVLRRLGLACALASGVAGCAVYSVVNPEGLFRQQLAERLGPETAAEIAIPFQIDDSIRALVDRAVSPAGSEKKRTDEILNFVFGGLDLQYSLYPTRDAKQTFATRQGNCLSFVNLFVGIARERRLNPFYVEVNDLQKWNYREGVVVSQGHIVAGMYVDGELSTFDFLPYQAKSYRDFKPITDLMAIAHYYNNLGAEALLDGDVERAMPLLELAVKLAPDFDKAVNNRGVALLRVGRPSEALELYQRGLELDPGNVALLSNSARAHQVLGNSDRANEILSQLEGVNESNPYFFVYLGELALGRGDVDTALKYMVRALRRDSEVPEVHLGFAKVYLALGDFQKARHHIERSLKLDATNAEARAYAGIIERGNVDGARP